MKVTTKYILTSVLFGLLMLGTGCSDSWLQTEPTDQASNETILSSTENAKSNQRFMQIDDNAAWCLLGLFRKQR